MNHLVLFCNVAWKPSSLFWLGIPRMPSAKSPDVGGGGGGERRRGVAGETFVSFTCVTFSWLCWLTLIKDLHQCPDWSSKSVKKGRILQMVGMSALANLFPPPPPPPPISKQEWEERSVCAGWQSRSLCSGYTVQIVGRAATANRYANSM